MRMSFVKWSIHVDQDLVVRQHGGHGLVLNIIAPGVGVVQLKQLDQLLQVLEPVLPASRKIGVGCWGGVDGGQCLDRREFT